MTSQLLTNKKTSQGSRFGTLICIALTCLMIFFGEELKNSIYNGFLFSFKTIIPTLFPFFILSDLWNCCFRLNTSGRLGKTFERIFGIGSIALPIWLTGLVCGFPLSVKAAGELWNEGLLNNDEFERLSGFSNNPSLAFVVFGVGGGVLGSTKIGILLYLTIVISSILTGFLYRISKVKCGFYGKNIEQRFDLVKSIKSAGFNSITIASYIIFFSGVMGLLSEVMNPKPFALISPFIELSNSVKLISTCKVFSINFKLALIAFALGFSGFSVHLQAFYFFPKGIKRKKYLLMKLTQGLIASVISFFTIDLLH